MKSKRGNAVDHTDNDDHAGYTTVEKASAIPLFDFIPFHHNLWLQLFYMFSVGIALLFSVKLNLKR